MMEWLVYDNYKKGFHLVSLLGQSWKAANESTMDIVHTRYRPNSLVISLTNFS